MNPSLLTYKQASDALKPMKVSVRSLSRYASKETPAERRLRVVRLSPCKVGIRQQDLAVWIARRAGEAI